MRTKVGNGFEHAPTFQPWKEKWNSVLVAEPRPAFPHPQDHHAVRVKGCGADSQLTEGKGVEIPSESQRPALETQSCNWQCRRHNFIGRWKLRALHILYKNINFLEEIVNLQEINKTLPIKMKTRNKLLWIEAQVFSKHLKNDCLEFKINFKCF